MREENHTADQKRSAGNPVARFFRILGPGLITGASDDDPSGIATYSVAGASLGFATLWTAILTLPLMTVVQFVCAKVGMVSGRGLAGVLRHYYSKKLLYPAVFCLLVANTLNAGTDIGAVAAALNLLIPLPVSFFIIPVALLILLLQVRLLSIDRPRFQVAYSTSICLCRVYLSCKAKLGRSFKGHIYSPIPK